MSVVVDGTNGLVFNDASTQTTAASGFGFKNRIINGAMVIDQRNSGNTVTANSSISPYVTDRFGVFPGGAVYTCQQVVDAPAGFVNSLKITVATAATSTAGQFTFTRQIIEGVNISDLAWGTAAASAVAISFWVKSSLTGTFAVSCINSSEDRSYPATFTINAAGVWEYKTITVPGDTTGTWLTNNSNGIRLAFDFGSGSNYNGTANVWQAGWKSRTSGCVSLSQTTSATFQITGVQLEKGPTPTPFDYRPYGIELVLCQRYYEQSEPLVAVASLYNSSSGLYGPAWNYSGASGLTAAVSFKVTKRSIPTIVIYTTNVSPNSTANYITYYQGGWTNGAGSATNQSVSAFTVSYSVGSTGSALAQFNWTSNSEL